MTTLLLLAALALGTRLLIGLIAFLAADRHNGRRVETPFDQPFDQHADEALAVAALASETPTYHATLAEFSAGCYADDEDEDEPTYPPRTDQRHTMTAHTSLTPAQMLAVLRDLGATYDPDNPYTATSDDDGPPEDTRTPSDPDGLAAENAWERQMRWFER